MSRYREFDQADDPEVPEGDAGFMGINARLAAESLSAGLLAGGYNVRLRDGTMTTRLGIRKPGWLNMVHPGASQRVTGVSRFYGSGSWKDPNGLEWVLMAADGGVYRHYPSNPRAPVKLPTGVRVLSECTFTSAFDRVYLFRGRHLAPLMMDDIDAGFVDLLPMWDPDKTSYNAAVVATGQVPEEVAYGPFLAVANNGLTLTGSTAKVVTVADHGYVTGQDVTVKGATGTAYNGRFNVTVLNEKTFTYEVTGTPASPDAGTPLVSKQSQYWKALGTVRTVDLTIVSGTNISAACTGHGFLTNDYVTITGVLVANSTSLNGTWRITGVPDGDTFTFTVASAPTGGGATGVTARGSRVVKGQSPESNANAWSRVWDVLPNAAEGVFVNNRLLVPTAYTPGMNGYDASSSWTKVDFIVALDIQDPLHFSFPNELRINKGSADEIVQVMKYNQDTVIVLKGASWGAVSGVTGDLSGVRLDMRADGYGSCGPRAGVVTGRNVLFASPGRGICGLVQNELGQTRGVDIPLSNNFEREMKRINWAAGRGIRLARWDDRLYCAVPIDGATQNNAVLVYDFRGPAGNQAGTADYESGQWESVDTGAGLCVQEWFTCAVNGRQRLGFIGQDGFASLIEECWEGDQIERPEQPDNLGLQRIAWRGRSRGYRCGTNGDKRYQRLELTLGVWNAQFSLAVRTGAASSEQTVLAREAMSRTKYLKPAGRVDYVEGNVNEDWSDPGRGDYSVGLVAGGVKPGFAAGMFQEVRLTAGVRTLAGRYAQWELSGTGRVMVKGAELSAMAGQRRNGVMV